jgi:hypothetical protein
MLPHMRSGTPSNALPSALWRPESLRVADRDVDVGDQLCPPKNSPFSMHSEVGHVLLDVRTD